MSIWQSATLTVAGLPIHYHRTGGDGPPLVLVHGFSDNGACWTRLARDLAADYDIIMPDARGHGASARIVPGEAPDLLGDLVGFIAALGLERPALLGHSMGATTAADYAAHYPQQVRALLLEDPPWREQADLDEEAETRREAYRAHLKEMQAQSQAELEALAHAQHPDWHALELGPWAESKRQLDLRFLDSPLAWWRPWREVARKIACPTLLITGDIDRGAIVTPEIAAEALTLLAQGELCHLPGAGHSIRRERYAAYLAAVRDFLARTVEL